MTPGHPYLTKEFDELRAHQRRAVNVLRNSLWARNMTDDEILTSEPQLDGKEEIEVEVALREAAQTLLDPHAEYLEAETHRQSAELARAMVNRVGAARGWPEAAANHLVNTLATWVHADQNTDEQESRRRNQDLRDALFLLLLADRIASDQVSLAP